jgi:protein-ribulosamine 3-kinase
MPDRPGAIEAAIGLALGLDGPVRIIRRAPLGGGSINRTERVDTDAGSFVLKTNPHARAGLFRAEADGLAALRDSRTSLVVPAVVACEETAPAFLVIEYLPRGVPTEGFDEQLGRGLAELHRTTSTRYGFERDNFCGATPQPNPWTDRWVEFYGAARLGYQLRLASDAGRLSSDEARRLERLVARLGTWLPEPAEGPALIHGDLWAGNLHVTPDGGPAIIDPAVYFAHREAELGMMHLFGGFSPRVFAAYDEAFPLDAGWRERLGLYQLYHVMNHLNLFGRGYHAQVMAMAGRYGM